MKITIKKKAMKDLIEHLERCLKNKTVFCVEDTLSSSTISYVNIEMENNESIYKKNDEIIQSTKLKNNNWYGN